MGYYSMLNSEDFFSNFSADEIGKKFEDFKKGCSEDSDYLEDYSFSLVCENIAAGCFEISLLCEDYYSKHYGDELLARFISAVIKEKTSCTLEFEGEDGSHWGYLITRGHVYLLDYILVVEVNHEHELRASRKLLLEEAKRKIAEGIALED